jgi:serine/threonine protein kinase/tetratricopeptide (TPR) repeat protein
MIGATISHYHILEKLGGGGMGVVYKAEDTRLKRTVALKFLPASLVCDEEAKTRFVHEAQSASALQHPNICTIHDIDETPDHQLFMVMDCYEGETLKQKIERELPSIEEAIDIATQVAQGLAKAHESGIIHRDIKSSNIMVGKDGIARIVDFGLAKLAGQTVLTKTGSTLGTIAYMSPEQAAGEHVDQRTDIWSLGVVMYEMLTGRLPFAGEYEQAIVFLILNEEPEPLTSSRRDVPAGLERIVEKALVKSAGKRYQHAGEIAADLHALKKELEAGVAKPRLIRLRIPRKKRPYVYGATAVLVAAIVAGRLFLSPGTSARIDSIAVLPLENLSGNPDQAYLADGIQEALITDLAKLSGFRRVIARSSVKRFGNTMLSPREIAEQLGVRALLTGSVLRFGGEIQVTAHLIDVPTENTVWSERYNRKAGDVLPLINEIVATLAHQIQLHLTSTEQARLQAPRKVNSDAFEAYLQGTFHYTKQSKEDCDKAERYFNLALEKDSTFALAYGGLALVWVIRGESGFQPPRETFPNAKTLIAKALEMDSTLADLHVDLANIKGATDWDWPGAILEFKRALAMNPNLADAHFFYADLLHYLRRTGEWESEMKRALELDPLNDFKRTYYGWNLNYAGRYDEAIPIFLKLLETGPNKSANYLGLWGAYYKKGMYGQALLAAKNYFLTSGGTEFGKSLSGDTAASKTDYRAAMRHTGEIMAQRSARQHVPAVRIARMFAHAGDNDKAMYWLERAYAARESPLMRLAVFWDWDDLRSDPRFQDLLWRMNLPPGK